MKKKLGIFNSLFSRISYNRRTTVKSFAYKSTDFQIIIKWILTLFIMNTLQFFLSCISSLKMLVCMDPAQSCLTSANLTDLTGSSVHWIFQARTVEWISFPNPGIELESPATSGIGRRILYLTVPKRWPMVYFIYLCILICQRVHKHDFINLEHQKTLTWEICLFHY